MHPVFRDNRPSWINYLRHCHADDLRRRRQGDRFGDSAIIPFGAVHWWAEVEERRVQKALAHPLPARVVDMGEEGVTVRVECPFCRREHEHVFVEWPGHAVDALCGQGRYALVLAE